MLRTFLKWLFAGLLALQISNVQAGPIHDAANSGDLEKVRQLVAADAAAVDSLDSDGKTALHHAAATGHLEIVKFLVANKASLNAMSRTRYTPIRLARGFGHAEVEAFLAKAMQEAAAASPARIPGAWPGRPIPPVSLPPQVVPPPANPVVKPAEVELPALSAELPPVDSSLLHRVIKGGKVGFIDGTGKVVIPATLPPDTGSSLLNEFSEGLLPVRETFGWKYIDASGQTAFKLGLGYSQVSSFKDGLAAVVNLQDKFGYINKEGKAVISPQFGLSFDFSQGYASVQRTGGGPAMFIDKTGAQAFREYSASMESFRDGLAAVALASDAAMIKMRGYINLKGELVVPCKYTQALACSDGMLVVADQEGWYALDTNGVVRVSGNFRPIRQFTEGLAAAKSDERWGFINKAGKLVIPAKYENAFHFSEGLAGVKLDGKWGFIDRAGKLVIEAKFTIPTSWETSRNKIPQFRGGLAQMPEGGKIGYIDRTGKWVWEPSE